MPRRPRGILAPGLYHVTTRGNRRERIYDDAADARRFLAAVAEVTKRLGWRCSGFCLMPNHYHLVLETTAPNLSAGLRRLNGSYARAFNRRHGLTGHLFEERFHSVAIRSTSHLLELTRYLALNPVRAGLCDEPADWSWSAYRALAGLAAPPTFFAVDDVLRLFGNDGVAARAAFTAFVADAPPAPVDLSVERWEWPYRSQRPTRLVRPRASRTRRRSAR